MIGLPFSEIIRAFLKCVLISFNLIFFCCTSLFYSLSSMLGMHLHPLGKGSNPCSSLPGHSVCEKIYFYSTPFICTNIWGFYLKIYTLKVDVVWLRIRLFSRPRNINWQDWKYTLFVIFICHNQNIQRHSAMGGHKLVADVVENIGLKFRFQSTFSIMRVYAMNREYSCRINVVNKIQIDTK